VRLLPSAGITRLHRYYEPLRLPPGPASPSRVASCPSVEHRSGSLVIACLSPCRVPSPLPRRDHRSTGCATPAATAFPVRTAGRLPQLAFSRLAQRSLTLWPADSLSRPRRPVDVKGSRQFVTSLSTSTASWRTTTSRCGSCTRGIKHTIHDARPKRKREESAVKPSVHPYSLTCASGLDALFSNRSRAVGTITAARSRRRSHPASRWIASGLTAFRPSPPSRSARCRRHL